MRCNGAVTSHTAQPMLMSAQRCQSIFNESPLRDSYDDPSITPIVTTRLRRTRGIPSNTLPNLLRALILRDG